MSTLRVLSALQSLLVAGYVRELAKEYKIQNIPLDINDIIYSYQRYCEKWSQKYKTDNVLVDAANGIITVEDDRSIKILGSHIVSEGAFTWKIKMISFTFAGDGSPPFIGIVKDDKEYLDAFFGGHKKDSSFWYNHGYQLCCKFGSRFAGDRFVDDGYSSIWQKDGEILEMALDLDQGTLSFKVDGEDYGVAFEDVEQKSYRLILATFECKDSKFQLLDS